ncbi:prepilin-type N-terminal cleavage/methylation domain-containing protein [Patescibacteria group bacterium]|nr:prepilin-type N-terminal cleavage/methylation domain-containing protein [Patescibacteria group bacterium]MBU1705306.1 prepilin-type N-terminal cleavage/methylation domain-containing protein [Patescibacteria group bacterium]
MKRAGREQSGFSLIEALLVVALFVIIFAATSPRLISSYHRYRLEASTQDLVHTIRYAQNKSMTGRDNDVYSIRLVNGAGGSFVLYKGDDYDARDASFDEVHELPAAFSLTDTIADADIIFTRLEGGTTDTGTLTIAWPDGNQSRSLSLNPTGRVDFN